MAVPKRNELHRPVLEILNNSSMLLSRGQILQEVISIFALTETELQEEVPSGQPRMENRTNWAITDLNKSGLINNPKRGLWEITPLGKQYLTTVL